uniref:Brix domain-containing protein ZK795.3 n=1 Tax=Bactrocera latifrons TaxID=174628 RepID=A0A0K8UN37_BACLA
MFRRQSRLRRGFLFRKSQKTRLEKTISKNVSFYSENLELKCNQSHNNFDVDIVDDEYKYGNSCTPKIMITTSHNPSARLKMFVKELRLIFPNAQRMNRGKNDLKQLVKLCCCNDVTDIIIVHEHRGIPDNIVISHLPNGPTAFFNISSVVMRHDVPFIGKMSEQSPHLIFHNFKTKIGQRAVNILQHLFPTPKGDSKRVITFANHDDFVSFRHHLYKHENKELELIEIGPRFQLKLYQIKLGILDEIQASDTEWTLRPYMNTSIKNRVLSLENGWDQNES